MDSAEEETSTSNKMATPTHPSSSCAHVNKPISVKVIGKKCTVISESYGREKGRIKRVKKKRKHAVDTLVLPVSKKYEPSTGSHQSFCATCSSESTIFPYSDDPYRPSHSSTLADWTALYVDLCYFLQFLLFPTWWLNGTIINAAQILLKEQAAERFVGFQNVALNERLQFKLVEKDRPFVQILHVDGKHWVAATNAGCSKGEVKIFDSAYSHLTLDTKKQICSFLRPQENRIKFVIANMQCQDGPGSCGLYAIAVCAALVAGKDPTTLEWEESSMRRHLYMCILQNRLTPFPLKRHPGSSSTIKKVVIEEEICCKCRMPAES